ncbi:MAG: N-formylglutamate amidohydrolase [Candidatus Cyclobacteriaceae bacterium M3_2C_046]
MSYSLILSCEHAGNFIPKPFQKYFTGAEDILNSHKGWDPGAAEIADFLQKKLKAPLFQNRNSRLLIEYNRSLNHPDLFSVFSFEMSLDEKNQLVKQYKIYRTNLMKLINVKLSHNFQVLHLAVHSFTPILNGQERAADLGILFDPERLAELVFSRKWKTLLQLEKPSWSIRHNYPYAGKDDGLTTYLRSIFQHNYLGIELEVNQKYYNTAEFEQIKHALVQSLQMFFST